ncbi:hypothetical protein PGT21_019524 [Puccinia graminis f. sp. tritici]|uniref:Uncharacterized protein n=1 Tax=Puccinia graminis f. sp. tritici TaxID=56615 RepID=A0A5B0SB00_PUCGR|nr:hypothetical protein PGT21_019524 [Puccinia graminis f. sp. tritici]KAA1135128.1 hypothetical protein PGTUg99_017152 [Puccinia graminis f. sp. tritici]
MSLSMDDIVHGNLDYPSPGFQGVNDKPSSPAPEPGNHHSSNKFEHTFEEVCDKLQSELKLDPQHLKIALLASKVVPEAGNTAVIFANDTYHQLDGPQPAETHEFDQVFKIFVRKMAHILLLVPTIKAYSNNPEWCSPKNSALLNPCKSLIILSCLLLLQTPIYRSPGHN